jgi:uncharacterized membrane protein (DUF106 family)
VFFIDRRTVPEFQVTTNAPESGSTDREERRKELEKKLEELNQKKHNLVQMLKQVQFMRFFC